MTLPKGWPTMSIAAAHGILTAPGARLEMGEETIGGVSTRVWKNVPPTLRDLFLASRSFGTREFLVYEDERATYDSWARATLAFAAELQAQGVRKGDRVALGMRNLPEWPVCFFATVIIGAIVTPLNAWWTGSELKYGLVDSGARIVVLDAERLERLSCHVSTCPKLEWIYVTRGEARNPTDEVVPKLRRLEDVIGGVSNWVSLPAGVVPDVPITCDDDAFILYTSGTSGMPKGALGTHRNICTAIGTIELGIARASLRRGEQPPAVTSDSPQTTTLLVVPLFHVTGCAVFLCPSIATGARLVLMRRWNARAAMKLIEDEKVNMTGGVPTIASQLIEDSALADHDLSSLQAITYGGAPSSPSLARKIVEAIPSAVGGNGWGMTETCGVFSSHMAEDYQNRPGSCGPLAPTGEWKVVSPAGETMPAGEVGELWVRGPQIVKGYWNQPEATAEVFMVDGWLRTGDLARLDEEGFCFITDRAKDMLIRGGENIYCIEVENILYSHSAVAEAALVGVPHPTLGEEPAAVVSLKPDATVSEAELRDFLAERLAAFKLPVKIAFWQGILPRNANGKIMKGELKNLFEPAET